MRWAIAVIAAIALAPVGAHAEQTDRFGTPSTIVPTWHLALPWFTHVQPPEGDGSTIYSVDVSPGALYFVTRDLAVGGVLPLHYSTTGSGDDRVQGWTFGMGPEVGFNVALTRDVSFFPILGFYYVSNTTKVGPSDEGKTKGTRGFIGLSMPFLLHINNVFMGIGPVIHLDVLSKTKVGRLDAQGADKILEGGLETTLGGWF